MKEWNLGALTLFITGFAAVLAILYLLGFWIPLGLNPFDYIGIADVVVRAAFALLPIAAMAAFWFAVAQLIVSPVLPPGAGANTKTGRYLRQNWKPIAAAWLMGGFTAFLYVPDPHRWTILVIGFVPFGIGLSNLSSLQELVPHDSLRQTLLVTLVMLPPLAYSTGRIESSGISRDMARPIIDASRLPSGINADAKNPAIYVGRLGDHVVLLESLTGSLILRRQKEGEDLVLRTR